MREKYIDEAVGIFCIFGICPDDKVDVSDGSKDIFICLDKSTAEKVCEAQRRFREELYKIFSDK